MSSSVAGKRIGFRCWEADRKRIDEIKGLGGPRNTPDVIRTAVRLAHILWCRRKGNLVLRNGREERDRQAISFLDAFVFNASYHDKLEVLIREQIKEAADPKIPFDDAYFLWRAHVSQLPGQGTDQEGRQPIDLRSLDFHEQKSFENLQLRCDAEFEVLLRELEGDDFAQSQSAIIRLSLMLYSFLLARCNLSGRECGYFDGADFISIHPLLVSQRNHDFAGVALPQRRGGLKEYLDEGQKLVDAALERVVPSESTSPTTIHRAMRYSLFAGGRRVRPIMCIGAANAISERAIGVELAACSLELVHTYSLVHDDLPSLDNDDMRRGLPTSHKVFGEAVAILAGDALLTLAFRVLAELKGISEARKIALIQELAIASGTVGGLLGGQIEDIEAEDRQIDGVLLEAIHRAKTGALLRASIRIGAIYAGATADQLAALTIYAVNVSRAFQIVDDILDFEDSTQLSSTEGGRQGSPKGTFTNVYGLDRAREMAEESLAEALSTLEDFDSRADHLRDLAKLIVHRTA